MRAQVHGYVVAIRFAVGILVVSAAIVLTLVTAGRDAVAPPTGGAGEEIRRRTTTLSRPCPLAASGSSGCAPQMRLGVTTVLAVAGTSSAVEQTSDQISLTRTAFRETVSVSSCAARADAASPPCFNWPCSLAADAPLDVPDCAKQRGQAPSAAVTKGP